MNSQNWIQVPFKYALIGHLLTGGVSLTITAVLIGVVAWVWGLGQELPNFGVFIACLATAEFVAQFLITLLDRRLERRRKRSTVGSIANTVAGVVVRCVAYLALALAMSGLTRLTAVIVGCTMIVSVCEAIAMRSWRDGLSDEEVAEAKRNTLKAAREIFQDGK
ncbi:hypothetical protein [Arcanobacterium bovis]|uniref:Uncharacterized protein n=1 Tax=Arcanobacterium bovis TaxID=2529275 RepID=A0A4Q9V2C5_9ACTO|nr:hypothetical protein [Arcanobacterium bovis]TBW23795.1 hypothetical protein EZJ44_01265 [Arcanobacterium bovis]